VSARRVAGAPYNPKNHLVSARRVVGAPYNPKTHLVSARREYSRSVRPAGTRYRNGASAMANRSTCHHEPAGFTV
jgi:hypothetical protein